MATISVTKRHPPLPEHTTQYHDGVVGYVSSTGSHRRSFADYDRPPAAAVTGGLAASAYLDGKFQLRRDVTALLKLRKAGHEYEKARKEAHQIVQGLCVADTPSQSKQTISRLGTFSRRPANGNLTTGRYGRGNALGASRNYMTR